ncbi:MAG: hypothetical protein PWR24_1696 [Desulfonauticus sp.]|jgi:hypothetical protein|nr:MAG: hypothetical protein XD41_1283 [Desulfonauticus sp. 38_4375]MDK2922139.1 hypothetical protein [Desulfonauticus sp.]
MGSIKDLRQYPINWDMTHEDAITLYLEWGNNPHRGYFPPVKSGKDVSYYFVLNTWEEEPKVCLYATNSDGARDLVCLDLPAELKSSVRREYGSLKGVFGLTPEIKKWLQNVLEK